MINFHFRILLYHSIEYCLCILRPISLMLKSISYFYSFSCFVSSYSCILYLGTRMTDIYIISRSETDLSDIYSILKENLYQFSSALNELESSLKGRPGSSQQTANDLNPINKDTVDIITTL